MTSDQATLLVDTLVPNAITLLTQIKFFSQATAVVCCFCFACQLVRLILQGKNTKDVF